MLLSEYKSFLDANHASETHPLAVLYRRFFEEASSNPNAELNELQLGKIQIAFAEYWHENKSKATSYIRVASLDNQLFFKFALLLASERYFGVQRPKDIFNQAVQTCLHIVMPGLESYVRVDGFTPLSLEADKSLIYLHHNGKDYVLHRDDVWQAIEVHQRVVYPFDPSAPMTHKHFSLFVKGLSENVLQQLRDMLSYQADMYRQYKDFFATVIALLRDQILPRWAVGANLSDDDINAVVDAFLRVVGPAIEIDGLLAGVMLTEADRMTLGALCAIMQSHQEGTLKKEYCLGTLMRAVLYALESFRDAHVFLGLLARPVPAAGLFAKPPVFAQAALKALLVPVP